VNATERYTRDGKTVTVRTRGDRVLVTEPGKPTEELVSTNAGITARQFTRNLVKDGYTQKGKP
jgi:hypothetical protein